MIVAGYYRGVGPDSLIWSNRQSNMNLLMTNNGLSLARWAFFESNDALRQNFPGSLRAYKDMPAYLNVWVAVDASQCHAMHLSIDYAAQCRATRTAEHETRTVLSDVGC